MPGSTAGSIEPSPSSTATRSAWAASSPACTAAPYPRRGSATTRAPSARATAAVASVEPLSTTSTGQPARQCGQDDRQRVGLVQARKNDLRIAVHATIFGR